MAQIPFRANTQTSVFPLLSQLQGRTVIVGGQDQTYIPSVNPSDQNSVSDRGNPQIFYGHNVMPSTYGIQSIGYVQAHPPLGVPSYVEDVQVIVATNGVRTYIAMDYTQDRGIWVLQPSGGWVKVSNSPVIDSSNPVTTATVNGVTYINVSRTATYEYDQVNNVFNEVTLKGLENNNVLGILSASGYLITWSRTGIAWSSTIDPLDFEPSDISGAGAAELQDLAGAIVFCQPTSYGFVVYSTNNALSVTYSGNNTFPFNARPIPGAGGLSSKELVTVETSGAQYAYTTSGIQQIYHTGAKTVLPYVTDFIGGNTFEDFNEVTNVFEVSTFSDTMRKKLTLVADRYLVISYGLYPNQPMTHAIIIDLVQTRTGKAKISHTKCIGLRNISDVVLDTARQSIGFVDVDGSIRYVDFGIQSPTSNGVLVLGKFQYVRQYNLLIDRVILENVQENATISAQILSTLDGKTFLPPVDLYPDPSNANKLVRIYYGGPVQEAVNHTLLVKGNFNIVSAVFDFHLGGKI